MFTIRLIICCFLFSLHPIIVLGGNTVYGYPVPLHADDPSQNDGRMFGRILIPSISVDETIRSGIHESIIDKGVAYWLGSAQPGSLGNLVLAGHRTTKTAPLRSIDRLVSGDEITIVLLDERVVMYRVYESFIVDPVEGVWVVNPPEEDGLSIMTIFSCHPLFSQKKRYVVRAKLVEQN